MEQQNNYQEISKTVKTSVDLFNFIETIKANGLGFTELTLKQKNSQATNNFFLNICMDRDHVVVKSDSGRVTFIDRGTGSAYWINPGQTEANIPPEQQIIQDRDELESMVHILKKFEPIAEVLGTTISGRTVELKQDGTFQFSNGEANEPSVYFLYQLIPTELDDKGKISIQRFDNEIDILSFSTKAKITQNKEAV